MAVTIKLKNASGSDPSASDLVVGEVALRTDTAKLFTKKDDNSVAEIGGSTLGDNDVTTAKIADDAVTFAKIQNISATDRLLGRDSSGAGIVEEIAPSAVRTMLGLASSATTDTTNASNISSGTLAAARVATLNQDTTGNAATATALETARNIAGVSFDGTANISLNNNAITNGAGYITSSDSSITNKLPLAGGTLTGNLTLSSTHPKIILTDTNSNPDFQIINNHGNFLIYDSTNATSPFNIDGSGNIQVSGTVDGRDLATDGSKLDGIASGATNVTNTNQLTNGAGFITSADGGNAATLDGIDSSQFLRSDTADSGSGLLTLSGGLALSGKVGAAITAASDGSTITLDLGANTHQSVTLGGNRTFAAPSNQTVGQSGSIFITQDGTGSRTASFNSAFKFVGGTAPSLSTSANATDRIDYVVKSSNVIHCAVSLDVK